MNKNRKTAASNPFAPLKLNDGISIVPRTCSLNSEPCTVVIGPPGGGKTTLLSQWYNELERLGEQPMWCSAMAGGIAGLPLATTIPGGATGRTLFVDDAEHVASLEIETYLAAMGAGGDDIPSRLVLATRATPERVLEWSRHGPVRTVRTDEVDLPEDLVRSTLLGYRPDLKPDELAVLIEKIGNWPAGAHLAGQAIGHPDAEPGAAYQFDGHDLGVCDYLDTEIFAGLDTADQHFLVTCSVLTELTPSACIMLTGDQLAEERLQRLALHHALILPSETTGMWRWRPLAQSYLRTKLRLRPTDDVAELRRRVRGWSMAHRSYPEAVAQAGETEDWDVIVRLILDVGLANVASGNGATVLKWIESLPSMIRKRETGLATVAAVATWATEGPEGQATIDDWLNHAAVVPRGRPPAGAPSVTVAVDLIRSLLGTLAPEERLVLATDAELDTTSNDSSWRALQLTAIGFAQYLADDSHQTRRVLADCIRQHGPSGERNGWFLGLFGSSVVGLLALVEQEANAHDQAAVLLSMVSLSSQAGQPIDPSGTTGLVELAYGRQAWHEGDHDLALLRFQTVGRSSGLVWVRALAMLDLAELCRRRDDGMQIAALASADELLAEMHPPPPILVRLRKSLDRHELQGIDVLDDSGLTERELEVLRLLNTELTRRQIAGQLFLAHNTVKTYIQRLYHKLGVSSRPAAIARARERGWLD